MTSKVHFEIRQRIYNQALTLDHQFSLRDILPQQGYSPTEKGVAEQLLRDLLKSGDIRKAPGQRTWYEWVND